MIWILALAVFLALAMALGFNALARMRNVVRNAWSDIDVQLKRRADLVPNLVETTKAYAGFEKSVLEEVARARSDAERTALTPSARAKAEDDLGLRIERVIAVAEAYPELKASAQYLRLQQELTTTEGKIASARQYYNAAVRDYNTMLETFPLAIVGALFNFKKAEFFDVETPAERDAPSATIS